MVKNATGLFVLLALLIVSPKTVDAEQAHLRINCTFHSPYEQFFFRIVQEMGDRSGISIERGEPPVGRSLIQVHEGMDDGDGPRIAGLSRSYPNIIAVPEPIGHFHFGAFARNDEIVLNGWDGLSNLNVAYIIGWKIFDINVVKAKSIVKVKNADLLFKLLDADRTDVALMTKISGYAAVNRLGLRDIHFIEPPLAVEPNYLYLNKKHERLIPDLVAALKDIKEDGAYKRLYEEIILTNMPE